MSSLLLLRHSNSAASVLSRCVAVISRGPAGSEGSASASASAALSSLFNLQQKRGVASRSFFDDDEASRRSTSHPVPNPEDLARIASGAAADVSSVVNQLNSVRFPFFSFSFLFDLMAAARMSTPFPPLSSSDVDAFPLSRDPVFSFRSSPTRLLSTWR